MKRILLFLAMMAVILPSFSERVQIGLLYYNLDTNTKTADVTYYKNNFDNESYVLGALTIPPTINYNGLSYSVTSIGNSAFFNCWSLSSVEIPNTVTSIGNGAFEGCNGMTSVTIPNSVTSIGNSAFSGCSGLTGVIIGNSVTSIGNEAFSGCSGLIKTAYPDRFSNPFRYGISIRYPANNSLIEDGIIYSKDKKNIYFASLELTGSFEIPNSVTSIGGEAFRGCSDLTSVVIGNSVTSIGKSAFQDCSGLTGELLIPNSVTSIGDWAFWDCSGLTNVEIGNSVSSIGSSAFQDCSGLTSMTIPNSVTSIGSSAFSSCSNLSVVEFNAENCQTCGSSESPAFPSTLTSVKFGENVKSIPAYAFYGCSGLTGIVIQNSVTKIGNNAFYGCSLMTRVLIGNSVTSIGSSAFMDCSGLTEVEFNAENCQTCGSSSSPAFPSTLTSVKIGENVKSIPAYAFYGCSDLTNVVIPNSVTSIGDRAFEDCSGMTTLSLGERLSAIGSMAFSDSKLLENIVVAAMVPPTAIDNIFSDDTYSYATLYVPERTLSSYKALSPWSKFVDIKTLDELPDLPNPDEPTEIKIVPVLAVGEKLRLSARNVNDEEVAEIQYWTSSDSSVASVDAEGTVSAIANGSVIITVTSENGAKADIEFEIIDDNSVASIDYTISLSEEDSAVFSTSGVKLLNSASKEDLKTLIPGIYIIGGKKVMVK